MAIALSDSGNSLSTAARTSASVTKTIASDVTLALAFLTFSNQLGGSVGCTIGGNAMTQRYYGDYNNGRYYLWYYVNPPTGSQTITASWTTSYVAEFGIMLFSGVNTSSPFSGSHSVSSGSGTSVTGSVTASAGQMLVQTLSIAVPGVYNTFTPTSGQTTTLNANDNDGSPSRRSVLAYLAAADGTNNMNGTLNTTETWYNGISILAPATSFKPIIIFPK